MRGISRAVCGRDAAVKMNEEPAVAHCAGQGDTWDFLEKTYRTDPDQILQDIRQLFCDECPLLKPCQRWARAEGYTGLAAGTRWSKGEPMWTQGE